jgi:hypothetical protein
MYKYHISILGPYVNPYPAKSPHRSQPRRWEHSSSPTPSIAMVNQPHKKAASLRLVLGEAAKWD